MRTKSGLRWLLVAGTAVLLVGGARAEDDAPAAPMFWPTVATPPPPTVVRGQDYAPEDPQFPLPTGSNRPEQGLYVGTEFVFFHQTRTIRAQLIGVRGFFDADGTVTGTVGTFVGSGTPALFANDLGSRSYQPGLNLVLGYRFHDGIAVELSWLDLQKVRYNGGASIEPNMFRGGQDLADTFLSSFVFNFPNEYAGPPFKISDPSRGVNPNATFGIWNAASIMTIEFAQTFQQWDFGGRIPIWETDCNRMYGLTGMRFAWFWERFRWRTTDIDTTGNAGPDDVAIYSNIVSNRMYGVDIGCGDECRLGDTPIGTFAVSLDWRAAALVDVVREIEKYERSDRFTAAKRNRTEYEIVPELQGQLNLWWYPPIEGVQVRVGYDLMGFFNTVSAPYPVAFNLLSPENTFRSGTFRMIDGFNAGIALSF